MTVTQITFPVIPAGQVVPELGLVVLAKGKRYRVVGLNRSTINVLDEAGKGYKMSLGATGTVLPDADQSWTLNTPELRIGQVVRLVGAAAAKKYPGHYVVIKTGGGSANVAVLGGDANGLGSYIRVPSASSVEVVTGTFQVS